jgi:hypothetical protein
MIDVLVRPAGSAFAIASILYAEMLEVTPGATILRSNSGNRR